MRTHVIALFTLGLLSLPAFAVEIELEDGTSFTSRTGTWTCEDGELVGHAESGEGAWLISDRTFADFDLTFEFNTSTTMTFLFRGHDLPVGPVPEGSAPEDISHMLYGYIGNPGQKMVLRGNPPEVKMVENFRQGEWNTLKISARGDSFSTSINGWNSPASTDLHHYTTGRLGFYLFGSDAEKASLRVRNFKITDLGRTGSWRALFNGKNLDGWVEWGTETWAVKDGVIEGTSGPDKSEGYLATKETWGDFHVRGTFKILGDGNYGLFYHSTIAYDDKKYPIISGIQTEVAPGTPSPSGWLYESYKRGWLVEPDNSNPAAYALNEGEWNEIEVLSKGNRVITWVNGINVADFTDPTPNYSEGAFALQLHAGGAEGILWKDLYVKE